MRNVSLTLSFIILLLGSTVAYSQVGKLTVTVDKSNYGDGEIVWIIGTVSAVLEGVTVTVQVFNPDNIMYTNDQTTPNSDGKFATTFNLSNAHGYSGIYTVKASYAGQSVQTTFRFTSSTSGETIIVDLCQSYVASASNDCIISYEIPINVDDHVIWRNLDYNTHTVTSGDMDDPSVWGVIFDSGLIKPDTIFAYTFDTAGEYPYLCQLHPWEIGKVIVKSSEQSDLDFASIEGSFNYAEEPELKLLVKQLKNGIVFISVNNTSKSNNYSLIIGTTDGVILKSRPPYGWKETAIIGENQNSCGDFHGWFHSYERDMAYHKCNINERTFITDTNPIAPNKAKVFRLKINSDLPMVEFHWRAGQHTVLPWKPFLDFGIFEVKNKYAKYANIEPPSDLNDVVITMERTACFGSCPVYSLTVHGNGTITYEGGDYVDVEGKQFSQISDDEVKELLDFFFKIDYFSLRSHYWQPISDQPSTITSITLDGVTTSVYNYFGGPKELFELQDKIDEITNSKQWVG